MRHIKRGHAPSCLADLRREAKRIERETQKPPTNDDWSPSDCAQPIREALWRDQHGLCAYCARSIKAIGHLDLPSSNGGMRIEHFIPREDEPQRMYEWNNLLGVCGGQSNGPGGNTSEQHCDRARGSTPLHMNPAGSGLRPEEVFRYRRHPERNELLIEADAPYNADIQTLNLNDSILAYARRQAEQAVAKRLKSAKNAQERRQLLERRLKAATTPNDEGQLPAFAPVVERYVRQKLRS
ncbi:TIGR02646 family protein [Myxococcota bacterium]|nr:TIGR02646 family protein [Myxococcota bacterium]MBU1900556.1 TIGR02646 family protein [Myxococcota bacterium]